MGRAHTHTPNSKDFQTAKTCKHVPAVSCEYHAAALRMPLGAVCCQIIIISLIISETGHENQEETKGRFRKRVALANDPRSGFRSRRTCERTLVPVAVAGEHPNVPLFWFSFRGNIRQNRPF